MSYISTLSVTIITITAIKYQVMLTAQSHSIQSESGTKKPTVIITVGSL